MGLRVAILILSTLGTAFSQTAPTMQAWPIGKLEVEGNRLYSDEKILQTAGLKVGQMAGKAEFDAARDRLLATGAFESVGYKFDPIPGTRANRGVFQIGEVTQVFPFRLEELRIDETALRAHLKTKFPLFDDTFPATQPVLDKLTKEVQSFAKSDKIVGRLDGAPNLEIVFRPSTLPSVAEVKFKGNTVMSNTKLQQTVAGAAVGAVYTENRFRQILDASLKPAYEALGYLRVQFPNLEVTPARNADGIIVTVEVNEGPIYKLAEVELKGELAGSKELLKIGAFETGEVANDEKIKIGVENIQKALRRQGYLEGKATAERQIDDDKKTLNLIVNVDAGPQFMMGRLIIQGLDLETEPHIRKLWALKRGQPFNVEYPDYFLSRLVEDQIMDNLGRTKSSIAPNPDAKTVDVTIVLEGEKRKPATPPVP